MADPVVIPIGESDPTVSVRELGGRTFTVRRPALRDVRRLRALELESFEDEVARAIAMLAVVVPDLAPEDVESLKPGTVAKLLYVATADLEEIEAALKGVAPDATAAPNSTTPTATPSPA